MSHFEVEVRGKMLNDQYEATKAYLTINGEYVESKRRILIDYSYYLPDGGIRRRTRDIRLRTTNGVPEIIVKVGRWGGKDQRKEFSVICPDEDFDKLVQMFAVLGFKKGVVCVRHSEVYMYKGVEIALVEVPGHSRYFEAEIIVDDVEDATIAHQGLERICKDLMLTPFSEKDFMDYVEQLNQEANEEFNFDSDWHPKFFDNRYKKETLRLPNKKGRASRA